MKLNRIQELEKLILKHKDLYYRGFAEISDEAFDKLEDELKKIDPQNPVLNLVGASIQQTSEKVQHKKKMLSLEKTYNEVDLVKWMEKKSVLSVYKIDGSSCSLIFQNGHLVTAKTRGDGTFGENITSKAIYISNLPKSIPAQGEVEIRGEIFCREKDFFQLSLEMESLKLERPSSQRNIVAGLLGRKENIQLAKHLSFKAFDIISDEKMQFEHQKMEKLQMLGFEIPEYEIHKNESDIKKRINEAKDFMLKGDYLIDGLVFVMDDLKLHAELGETAHHPRYKIAFKFAGDTKNTVIQNIEWGVSRNGILTPVANVEPVELSGAMISRVTLHNFGLVKNFNLKSGDEIEIIRSGEVIPKFLGVKKAKKGDFEFPENCPSCGSKLTIQDIWLSCENEMCPAKLKEEILNYVHKSGIDDLSDKRLDEMINKGIISSIEDLYKINMETLLKLDKVKDKLAKKIYDNIQKTKQQNLIQFISAIGLEGVSAAKTEKIIFHGFNSLEKILSLDVEKLKNIDGFADKSSQAFIESLLKKKKMILNLIALGVEVKSDELVSGEGPLKNMKFCITGELTMPRTEFEKIIKKNGGIMVSSVSKNTNYLITNEIESSSSKFTKAKDLGIPIKTENEILSMIGE
jgi:DNA ligase (NAD+)